MTRFAAGARFCLAGACAGLVALGAAPPASQAAKEAFLALPGLYAQFEITVTGAREFGAGTPKDALTDGAHRTSQYVRFELPVNRASPGAFPASSLPLSQEEMFEPGRFMTWMSMPDTTGVEETLTSGTMELAKNPMFAPAEFSIDDVVRYRYRDSPADGFGTNTTTTKGKGVVYAMISGMVGCDLKKMTCDLNNFPGDFHDGTDKATVAQTSDVPGFEAKTNSEGPAHFLIKVPPEITKRLVGASLTLPLPSTITLTGPVAMTGRPNLTCTLKVTLSDKPAPRAATKPAATTR